MVRELHKRSGGWNGESQGHCSDKSKTGNGRVPAQSRRRLWSDAFNQHVFVGVFGQLKAKHVPTALHKRNLAVAILENIETANAALRGD